MRSAFRVRRGCRDVEAQPSPSCAQRGPDALTAGSPPGPGSCRPVLTTLWSPFPTSTCPCGRSLVLNTLSEFKGSYSDDSQISMANPGLC